MLGHFMVGGEGLAREAVPEAGGDEEVVGEGKVGVGGQAGGAGEQRGVGGVDGEEAGEEVGVAREAEGEGEAMELGTEAKVGAVEVEEGSDGAEEEVGRSCREAVAEAGESEEREGEKADS
jgi:hypothetical protein